MSHPKTTVDSQRSQDRLIEMLVQLSYRFDSNKDGVCSLLQAPTSKRGYCVIVFGFFSFGGTVLLGFLTHFTDISVSVECFHSSFLSAAELVGTVESDRCSSSCRRCEKNVVQIQSRPHPWNEWHWKGKIRQTRTSQSEMRATFALGHHEKWMKIGCKLFNLERLGIGRWS